MDKWESGGGKSQKGEGKRFTGHTLAHPFNCMLQGWPDYQIMLRPGIKPGSDAGGMRLIH